MTVSTPLEAVEFVKAFIADLPGKVFRSLVFAFGQTGNLLALAAMFVLGVIGQPIAGPYLARYGLPLAKAPEVAPTKPDAVLGQIQRLYAAIGEQGQAVATIQGSLDDLRTKMSKRTPLNPPPSVQVRKVKPQPQPMPAAPAPDRTTTDTLTTIKDGVKSLLPKL